ncbi:MAG: TlpA family protein disulfide reductase [Gemmatimonadaceae bacterium]|nr:TlpA family protein disulfide reductase [Gemmatimonadaceae bacterium]
MSTTRQWQLVGLIVAFLGAGLMYAGTAGVGNVEAVRVGAKAPNFHAATLDGTAQTRTLADYKGEVLLVNLWATWCGPCVVEMPSIQRLYDRYRDKGLKVVAVAVDDPGYEQRVLDFVAERKLTFEILHEGTGKIEALFQTQGIPATFLIGRDGRIRKLSLGADDWDSPANRAVVAQLLGVEETGAP